MKIKSKEFHCPSCGKVVQNPVYGNDVTEDQRRRYFNDEKIQDIFPRWTTSKRELMLSGTCLDCQCKFFD